MYVAKIDENQVFEIKLTEKQILVNDQPFSADFCTIDPKNLHILHENKGYSVKILSQEGNLVRLKINEQYYEVTVQDELEQQLAKIGINPNADKKANELKSPMPGMVLRLLVGVGDKVQKGDSLIVLESMKMENILKATGEGTVLAVCCTAGNTVEKGEILLKFG